MLVDDEPEILKVLEVILGRQGYRVMTYTNAETALSDISGGIRPDLVITDYCMPGMNGLDFIASLNRRRPKVPAILLTAFGDLDAYLKAFAIGIFDYLPKPVTGKELNRVVKAALNSGHGQSRTNETGV